MPFLPVSSLCCQNLQAAEHALTKWHGPPRRSDALHARAPRHETCFATSVMKMNRAAKVPQVKQGAVEAPATAADDGAPAIEACGRTAEPMSDSGAAKPGTRNKAYEAAVLPQLDGLYRFALRLCHDPLMAEDLVQDTALKAFRAWHCFREDASPRPWLFRILWNSYLNERRRRVREQPLEDAAEPIAETEDPERAAASSELRATLSNALGLLPEDQRAVVMLVDLEDLRYRDAAMVLDIPIGTVMSRLARGRARLAEALEKGRRRTRTRSAPQPQPQAQPDADSDSAFAA